MTKVLYLGLDPQNFETENTLTHFPLIEIIPKSPPEVERLLTHFSLYTHVIITSKSSAKIMQEVVSIKEWSLKTTIAVGKATADYLTSLGLKKILTAKDETAEGIVDILKQQNLSRAFVFWPHAALARPLIANFLHEKMIPYSEATLYDTKLHEPASAPDLNEYKEIVFTSPSTVDAFVKLYGTLPADKILTSIGPITAQKLVTSQKRIV